MPSKPTSKFVCIVAAVAALGGLLFGFDTGVISGAILFIRKSFQLDHVGQEFVVSAVLWGCIIGAGFSGGLTDRFGRRRIIIATSVIFGIGTCVASFAPTTHILMLGRFILGLAIGVASYAVPLYISEIAPARMRGALVSLNQLAITIGIVVSYLVDDLFAPMDQGWRWMFLAGLVPAVVLGIGMFLLPETPRWLTGKNRISEAEKVTARIDPSCDPIRKVADFKSAMAGESKGRWGDLWAPHLRTPLLIGIGIMFFQQLTGINTVIYYAPTIFEMAGFHSSSAALGATMGVGLVNVAMTVVSLWLIDRWGRKPLLYIGLIGMFVGLASLGLAFYLKQDLGPMLKWIAVGSLLVYIGSFAISLGPIAWLIIAEIYPLKVRGLAMSLATLSNWLFNLLVAISFLSIVDGLGASGAFWLYAALCIGGFIFCMARVPETKGHTLEEIEKHWLARKPARDL